MRGFLGAKLRKLLIISGFDTPIIKLLDPTNSFSKPHLQAIYFRPDMGRYRSQKFYANTMKIIHLTKLYKNPQFLADHVASELERNKKHTSFLYALRTMLQRAYPGRGGLRRRRRRRRLSSKKRRYKKRIRLFPKKRLKYIKTPTSQRKAYRRNRIFAYYTAIRISIFGKLNARPRARSFIITVGPRLNVEINTFSNKINYAVAHARARTGAFGVKV